MAASTWPTSVVGTAIHCRPRRNVAAAKPATSVTAPPPMATTTSRRSSSAAARPRHSSSSCRIDFARSPPGTTMVGTPAGARCATASSTITAARRSPIAASSVATAPGRQRGATTIDAATTSGAGEASTCTSQAAA